MKLQVRAGLRVDRDLRGIARYLRGQRKSAQEINRLVNELIDKMIMLGETHVGRRVSEGLPAEYRRYGVGKYTIYYLINEPANQMTVYHIRHGVRRPLATATHRQLARDAEQVNYPISPPPHRSLERLRMRLLTFYKFAIPARLLRALIPTIIMDCLPRTRVATPARLFRAFKDQINKPTLLERWLSIFPDLVAPA